MFGFPVAAEAPSFARFFERIHPDDRTRMAEQLHHAMTHQADTLVEYRYRGPSGQYRHARQQVTFDTPPRTGHKAPVVVHGMVQDITEQRQRDELLRLQRDLLLALGITTTVEDCLGLCLRTALRAESVDAGAAWVRAELPGMPGSSHEQDGTVRHEWRLVAAQGFDPVVLDRMRCLPSGTPATRLMEAGRPVPETPPEQESCCMLTGDVELDALATASSICCAHLLPILHEGRAVACLLTGTRGPGAMRKAARHHVEAVAAQWRQRLCPNRAATVAARERGQPARPAQRAAPQRLPARRHWPGAGLQRHRCRAPGHHPGRHAGPHAGGLHSR
ncbi:PAS domain-containing protein [Nitratidesulfovibrio liaohensis]|uniref:PAS domain-containing protein n=1 Tax=Nitratidesulfovibrio liaohensis TaxID=2604158 RepID=A0ABY9QZF1_9BACT|nr:PAS domain-containing protein [Nitratidesulfovibrio liaohensis]WMW64884.1 PAS domain-containing protein [Nitratidesulfovibrio liaohensis]